MLKSNDNFNKLGINNVKLVPNQKLKKNDSNETFK